MGPTFRTIFFLFFIASHYSFAEPPSSFHFDDEVLAKASELELLYEAAVIPDLNDPKKPPKRPGFVDKNFAAFVSMLSYLSAYVSEFQKVNDKHYGDLADFNADYSHPIKILNSRVSLEIDAWKRTAVNPSISSIGQGGGAGVRVDLKKSEDDAFSFYLMPLYGERRVFRNTEFRNRIDSDYVFRGSAGIGYSWKPMRNSAHDLEAGVQVLYQPQLVDFDQYRVYAEAYARFRVLRRKGGAKYWKLKEILLVPKVIYVKSTDSAPDLMEQDLSLRSEYERSRSNLLLLCKMEFRFHL